MGAQTAPDPPEGLAALRELAFDLRWTWSHETDALWADIDADLWEQTRNPWAVLQQVDPGRLDRLMGTQGFLDRLQSLASQRRAYLERPGWSEAVPGAAALGKIAYFSMEFGLGEGLPLYAGGLGVLAGDFLKAASDLALPVIGVGLLYQEGYFRQTVDADGVQHEAYPYHEPATMPIEPVMVDGAWLRIEIDLPGRVLRLRVWRATVGRLTLCLLDSNDPLNTPADRGVTGKLYGGDAETRLLQEIVLGVGGWRALEAMGEAVAICHINEGHAAFVVLERALRLATRLGLDFWEAFWATRVGNIFTTHTPVAAAFDRFDPDLLRRYLASAVDPLPVAGLTMDDILGFGRADPGDETEPFNMAYLAARGSGARLAVSRLHGQVSRRIFQPLFPRWPEGEVPVGHVTNGVHTPSWDSAEADRVWTDACGKERWRGVSTATADRIASVSDEEIWRMRGASRQKLVARLRRRLDAQLRARGLEPEAVLPAEGVLDANVLTLGFARRFTDYKRPNLLLRDPERFARLLLDERRPAQIVVAGKAHPADEAGKTMIRDWIHAAREPRLRRRIVFLEDYDVALAQELVQGVDVWINTPRRPWEACGTSGMKVLVNGGLNCSVRDGWWDEAYEPDLGWSIDHDGGSEADVDAAEAARTYELLERRIAPEFYDRDETGVPRAWVARIRRSMSALTATFGAARMAREYAEGHYLPAAEALSRRAADGHALAKSLAAWGGRLARSWPGLRIGEPRVDRSEADWRFSVPVLLGEIVPEDVAVEIYADPVDGGAAEVVAMTREGAIPGAAGGFIFTGQVRTARAADDFTIRAVPRRGEALLPAEIPLIAWQR
jgi:starch phosphorylase